MELISKYWSFLFFLGTIVWSYANLKGHVGQLHNRVSDVEVDIEALKGDLKEMSPIWQEIKERLVSIETSLKIHFKDK